MLNKLTSNCAFKIFLAAVSLIWFYLYAQTIQVPLQGTHQWRQSDTLFTAYYFCAENTDIMHPKIGPRRDTGGVAIGEFPFYSWMVGKWCQAKGSWDEVSPKVINFLFYFLAIWFWWIFLHNQYHLKNVRWYHWAALCFYSMISLSFLTIPMPEATALLFFGAAGAFWSSPKIKPLLNNNLGAIAFAFGFLLRPYHIPFLVMFKPKVKYFIGTFIFCVLLFAFWYKYWPAQATEVHGHYGIGFEGLGKILSSLPGALAMIPIRVLEHTSLIGLLLVPMVFKKDWLLILLYVGSIGMMVLLKATHIQNHAYYLMNAAFIALTIMVYGLDLLKTDTKRNLFLMAFILIGIGNTIHNIRPNSVQIHAVEIEGLAKTIPPDAKVTTFTGGSPQYLYLLKRTGWLAEPESFQGGSSCPKGSDYYLIQSPDSHYTLGKCQNGN